MELDAYVYVSMYWMSFTKDKSHSLKNDIHSPPLPDKTDTQHRRTLSVIVTYLDSFMAMTTTMNDPHPPTTYKNGKNKQGLILTWQKREREDQT